MALKVLHYKIYNTERADAPEWPVFLLHGLFGSGDNFHSVASALSEKYRVIVPDLRNHGRSFHDADTSYKALSSDIETLFDTLKISTAVVCGHSMGGKCAMRFACLHPERTTGLIIEDMGPGKHPERYGREVRLMRSLNAQELSSRKEAQDILEEEIKDPVLALFLLKNLERRKEGGFQWRNNLVGIAEGYDEIWKAAVTREMSYNGPSLFITGERSSAVSREDVQLIESQFPESRTVSVPGAGHWVHAQKKDEFIELVIHFLDECEAST